jgi:sugar phosphate permease
LKPKIFYGWWILAALLPACIIHAGAPFYAFGIFYKPLALEFGWTRSEIALVITIFMLTMGLTSPLIGKLTERFSPKKIILSGAILGGICFILVSRVTSLWQLYLLYFIIGWSYSACGAIPVSTVVARWFTDKRGLAIGIAVAGISLGGFVIAPPAAYFMTAFGWRATYIFLGTASFLLVIPPVLFFIRNTPEEMGLLPYVEEKNTVSAAAPDKRPHEPPADKGENWTLSGAMRTKTFWLVCISISMIYFGIGSVLQHQINFLNDMGISLTAAAVALGITGAIGALGKVAFGFICDRFAAKYVAACCFTLQALGIVLLLFAQSMTMIWIFVLVFGFSMGGQYAMQPLLTIYFFGLKSFATIYGLVYMSGGIGSALGPLLTAFIYDTYGNYNYAFAICAVAAVLASFIILSTRRVLSTK